MFTNPRNDNGDFKRFSELPLNLRTMIIDRMQAIDRCRFAACSKKCLIEATSSKKFIYGLHLYGSYENVLSIKVRYSSRKEELRHGSQLDFDRKCGIRYLKYSNLFSKELWRMELDSRSNRSG